MSSIFCCCCCIFFTKYFFWTPSLRITTMRNLRIKKKWNRKRGFDKLKCCVCRAAERFQLNWGYCVYITMIDGWQSVNLSFIWTNFLTIESKFWKFLRIEKEFSMKKRYILNWDKGCYWQDCLGYKLYDGSKLNIRWKGLIWLSNYLENS